MERLTDHSTKRLNWLQPNTFVRAFELRSRNHLFGVLGFESDFGTLASAEATTGRWSFKRVGFLNPHVTIRESGDRSNLAVFWPKIWGDGTLNFFSGKKFHWVPLNAWRTSWGFTDSDDQRVYRLSSGSDKPKWKDILKEQAIIEIDISALDHPDLALLICTGWYLTILQQEDIATVAAITAATAGD
jgi:hypothetical protein